MENNDIYMSKKGQELLKKAQEILQGREESCFLFKPVPSKTHLGDVTFDLEGIGLPLWTAKN
jgi:hypothetical protein